MAFFWRCGQGSYPLRTHSLQCPQGQSQREHKSATVWILNSANREGLWEVSSNCCYPKQCFSPSQKRTPWRMFPEVFWSDSITQGSTEPLFFKHSFKRGKKDDLGHLALAAFSEPILFAAASSDRKQSMFLLKRMQDTGKDRWLLSLWDGYFVTKSKNYTSADSDQWPI